MSNLLSRLQSSLGSAFRVDRELGGGGMSRVFVAEEVALGRTVVIKLLPPDTAAAVSAERFRREIQVAARLQHPHIVPLISAGEMEGLPYFIMPFVEGESLRLRLTRQGEMPLSEAVRTLREVASALAYAHDRGVVHRDIKPENVLISHGSAMVTDFGVAKAISASADQPQHGGLTSMGMAMGTPAYMAPEQAAADPATDHRADIYALGVMAYELLAGATPFAGRSAGQMLAAHLAEAPEPIDARRSSVPESLATLVMRCLEKRPADRPQSAAEVVRALDDVLSTGAMTPVTGSRSARRGRRVPARNAMLATTALLLLLVGGAVWRGFIWSASEVEPRATILAVLPFEHQGPPEDAYFADGLAEAIANRLANLEGLSVIDRRSTQEYAGTRKGLREIGEELRVDYLLVGTVQWAPTGDGERRVRISPSLVRASDATTRWAGEPYIVTPTDVFEVQADVAVRVARALDMALGERERRQLAERPTADAEAYDYFMRGESYLRRAQGIAEPRFLILADEMYGRAIERDPRFAAAYAKRAHARFNYAMAAPADAQRRDALESAMSDAMRVDSTHPDTRATRAWYLFVYSDDRDRAYEEMVRAQAARPNDASLLAQLGSQLVMRGRADEGLAHLDRATVLDPRSMPVLNTALMTAINHRRFDLALGYADRMIEIEPESWVGYIGRVNVLLLHRGDSAGARRTLESVERRLPQPPSTILSVYQTLGPVYEERVIRMTLADVRATQAFDSVNFYLTRGMTMQARRHPGAGAQLDSAVALLDALRGPAVSAGMLHAAYALVYASLNREADARRELEESRSLVIPSLGRGTQYQSTLSTIAMAETMLGDYDASVSTLELALQYPTGITVDYLRIDPLFAKMRGHPRFERLVGR